MNSLIPDAMAQTAGATPGGAGTTSLIMMAVFVVLVNRVFWKKMYRLAEDRYSLSA